MINTRGVDACNRSTGGCHIVGSLRLDVYNEDDNDTNSVPSL